MTTTVHETDVDGVRCFWIDSGRPTLTASLVFRAGMVDETFAQRGWTHLLEHLALHGRGGGALQVNGSVSLLTTSFDAQGPADLVSQHLCTVTKWLAEPDLGDLDHEVRILRAEHHTRGGGAVPDALLWRYGARGPGLAAADELGLTVVRADGLRARSAELFTWSNAVLALDGPPPTDLRLALPAGTGRRLIGEAVPCALPLPGRYVGPGVSISGTTTRSVAATLLPFLLEKLLRDQLRDRDASSYAPWSHYEPVDADTAVVFAGADTTPESVTTAAGSATDVLRGLAERGPDAADLADVVVRVTQGMRDPYNVAGFAWRTAHRWLQGHEPETLDAAIRAIDELTPEDLREEAERVARTALLGAPEAAVGPTGYAPIERPNGSPADGTTFRSRNWPADRTQLTVGPEQLQVRGTERIHAVHFREAVGLIQYANGVRTLVAADGWNLTVEPAVWTRGAEAVTLLDARVPADLHVHPLVEGPYEAPTRMSFVRRWWLGLRLALRSRTAAGIALVVSGVAFLVALAFGSLPGMFASGMFIYTILKESRGSVADPAPRDNDHVRPPI